MVVVRDGDIINIDTDEKSLNANLSDEKLADRRTKWQPTMVFERFDR